MPLNDQTEFQIYSKAITRMFTLMRVKNEPEMVSEWVKYLIDKNITPQMVAMACQKTLDDPDINPFRFTIAQFLQYVKTPELNPADQAIDEWKKVLKYVTSGQSAKGFPEDWGQRTVSAVESMGGLRVIGDSEEEKLSYMEHNFTTAFKAFARIHAADEKQILLEGMTGDTHKAIEAAMKSTEI